MVRHNTVRLSGISAAQDLYGSDLPTALDSCGVFFVDDLRHTRRQFFLRSIEDIAFSRPRRKCAFHDFVDFMVTLLAESDEVCAVLVYAFLVVEVMNVQVVSVAAYHTLAAVAVYHLLA